MHDVPNTPPHYGRGAMFGAAAAGLLAGLAATMGRKAAVQSMTAVKGDWLDGLKTEHRAVLRIFDAIERTDSGDRLQRRTLLRKLKSALAHHAFQEENVVYPALRQHGDVEAADHLNHEHGYVKQKLFELSELPSDQPQWSEKVRAFRGELEAHMEDEESRLFPELHKALGEAGNKHLTYVMNLEGMKLA